MFDVLILVLVGYSCITTIYLVAFEEDEENLVFFLFNQITEGLFYIDIILNFVHEKRIGYNEVITKF